MKPDVIQQTAELNRTMMTLQQRQLQQQQQQQQPSTAAEAIIMHQEGKEPVALTNDQVISIIQSQQAQVKELTAIVGGLQREKAKLEKMVGYITAAHSSQPQPASFLETESIALSECLSDLNARDETIKKLKGLYTKSLSDAGDLKIQLAEMRKTVQDLQTNRHIESNVRNELISEQNNIIND